MKQYNIIVPLSKSGSKSTGSVFVLFSMQSSLTAKENVAYQQLNHDVLHVATHVGLVAVALTLLVVYSHACVKHIYFLK